MRELHERLTENAQLDMYPMHMPGHKRNPLFGGGLPVGEDITEIEGFDNLHELSGVLGRLAARFAGLYHGDCAFPLINGATGGILASIRALTRPGDCILMARNCHKSVYHAVELCHLTPVYLMPEQSDGIFGSISPSAVQAALTVHAEIRLVVLTSPTYEGVISNIRSIAKITHAAGIPLFVDAAHGAHLGFSPELPESPVTCGADVTVFSLHKTLAAVTQTALLVTARGYAKDIMRELAVFETSSPSYLLMESMESCAEILETHGEELFRQYLRRLERFASAASGWRRLRLFDGADSFDCDPGKLVILTGGTSVTGPMLAGILRQKYRIETEMAYPGYVICMTGICDTDEGFDRLSRALYEIDRQLTTDTSALPVNADVGLLQRLPVCICTSAEARSQAKESVPFSSSAGCVAGEYLWAYPPGVPLIVPGEVIGKGLIGQVQAFLDAGVSVKSTSGEMPQKILTLIGKNY